jgi:hypothetical protein
LDRPIRVIAAPAAKSCGENDPEFQFTLFDIRRGEYISLETTGTLTREPGEEPGEYQLLPGTLTLPKRYEIAEFIPAALNIKPEVIAVAPPDAAALRNVSLCTGASEVAVATSLQQALDEIGRNGIICLWHIIYI